jgi:hypothetical protein
MYKTLGIAVVLLAAFAFLSGSRSADASPTTPISPPIVARAKLLNQTAPIPTTTILTPTQSGLYRLSVYGTVTQLDTISTVFWDFQPSWTDDNGTPNLLTGFYFTENGDSTVQPFFWTADGFSGASVVLQAKAGTPITYAVTQTGALGNGQYSLYYTLERLE